MESTGMEDDKNLSFSRGEKLFSTRACEGYRGVVSGDESGEIVLWIHRHALAAEAESSFNKRLEIFAECELPIARLWGYGIDERGHGWVATDLISGTSFLEMNQGNYEKGFVRAVQIVAALHARGQVIGDICEDSFIVDSKGSVYLQAFLGEFEAALNKTAKMPPKETFHFLAPEQRTGGAPATTSDVFALGVLGYRLFAGKYPSLSGNPLDSVDNIPSKIPSPSTVNPDVPVWLDDVLGKCLESSIPSRFENANEALDLIKMSLESGEAPGGNSRWSKKTVMLDAAALPSILNQAKKAIKEDKSSIEADSTKKAEAASSQEGKPVAQSVKEPIAKPVAKKVEDQGLKVSSIPVEKPQEPQKGSNNASEGVLVLDRKTEKSSPNSDKSSTKIAEQKKTKSPEKSKRAKRPDSSVQTKQSRGGLGALIPFLCFSIFALLCLIAGMLFWPQSESVAPIAKVDVEVDYDSVPSSLKPAINDLKSSEVSFEVKENALKKIAESDNPSAYRLVSSIVEQEGGSKLGQAAWSNIVSMLDRKKMSHSARIINDWHGTMMKSGTNIGPLAPPILQILDNSLPIPKRQAELRTLHDRSPIFALYLSAALGLDTKGDYTFTPILKSFLKEKSGNNDLDEKSIYAVILSEKDLLLQFEEAVSASFADFSENDLAWGMLFLAEQNNLLLKNVANEVLAREVVPTFKREFVRVLAGVDHFSLNKKLKLALVRGSTGKTRIDDIPALGRWSNQEAERLLLIICAITEDEKVRNNAFATVAQRSVSFEPARTLVRWVQNNYWKKKGSLAKAIAVISLQDLASDEQVEKAFDILLPYLKDEKAFRMFEKLGDEKLSLMALKKVGKILPDTVLFELLKHKRKEVRMKAVESLRGRNGLHVLQMINRAYEREKDPDVKKVFEKSSWIRKDKK